jgi:plasmid stability protein
MSTAITIRDVPDATKEELAARAARSGRSLQEYLRMRLVSRIRERKAATRSHIGLDRIIEYRDSDRR